MISTDIKAEYQPLPKTDMANVLLSQNAALLIDGSALQKGLLNFSHLWRLKLNPYCDLVASDNIIFVKRVFTDKAAVPCNLQ